MGFDPNYLYDNADVIWYGTEGYQNAISALQQVTGKSDLAVEMNLNARYGAADYWTAMQALRDQGVVTAYNSNGYRCFAYQDSVMTTMPTGPMYASDSNATTTTLVQAAPVYDTVVDNVPTSPTQGRVLVNPAGSLLTPQHGFYGWRFFAGECLQAFSAASVGISLGKILSEGIYNLNPDYWDSIGMSSFDPDTWSSITNGDDSFAAGLFNMIFGIDPNTGNAQAFLDQNAYAYLAYVLAQNGWFGGQYSTVSDYPSDIKNADILPNYVPFVVSNGFISSGIISGKRVVFIDTFDDNVIIYRQANSAGGLLIYFSDTPKTVTKTRIRETYNPTTGEMEKSTTSTSTHSVNAEYTYDGKTVYTSISTGNVFGFGTSNFTVQGGVNEVSVLALDSNIRDPCAWLALYNSVPPSTVEGVSDNPNATQPNTSTWQDVPSTLSSLQNQYPDLWNNAVPNTVVQPDGSTNTITYIPVPTPQVDNPWESQPTSNPNSTQPQPQVQPQVEPTTENNDLLQTILQLLTLYQPQTDTETETQTQPQPDIPNPPTTGDGDSPTSVAPTGSASALWSVYHPTQAQVNSFGAWLWGSPFLTNIGKLFQNPIDGVISLHKIFAPPVDSGSSTIVVGTLDSEVPSATVNQQYVYVDCGNVSCAEYFGTVFDYPPHTNVSLYLPFIGIVPLDTNDVMRSTINVTYGVDVYTGACLAMVEVTRDGSTVNMYQYAGVASVEYPLSNVQNGQLVSGLLSIGAGVASMIATGGVTAPAVGAVAAGAAAGAKSSVSKSGGFSGNAGAMGIKKPYLIIQRPQVKTATTFPRLIGYPTNYSCKLSECSNHVVVKHVHVEGINATENELTQIETLLKDGVLV